jgi:hypothetical protein
MSGIAVSCVAPAQSLLCAGLSAYSQAPVRTDSRTGLGSALSFLVTHKNPSEADTEEPQGAGRKAMLTGAL